MATVFVAVERIGADTFANLHNLISLAPNAVAGSDASIDKAILSDGGGCLEPDPPSRWLASPSLRAGG